MKKIILLILFLNALCAKSQSYQWTKSFANASPTSYSYTRGIKTDSQGNTYSFGSNQGTADLDPSPTVFNIAAGYYLLKLDHDGNFVWAKEVGDINIVSLNIDNNGDLLLTGVFNGVADFDFGVNEFLLNAGNPSGNIFVLKLNSNGDFIWAKNYGGIGIDGGTTILYDSNNNVIVSGIFGYTVDFSSGLGTQIFNANQGGGFCLKLSPNGDLIWVKQITGYKIYVENSAIDSNDNIYLCGSFGESINYVVNGIPTSIPNYDGSSYYNDGFIQKINSQGDTTWAYTIRGNNSDVVNCLSVDTNNNLIAYGHQGLSTIDYNPSSQVNTIPANSYHFVLKFDANQNFSWVKGIGGNANRCFDLKVDNNNNSISVLGSFSGQVSFDPGSGLGIPNVSGSGYDNIFILNLDSNGNYNWGTYQVINASNFIAKMDINNSNLYVTSSFRNISDFNPLSTHDYITSSGQSDNYISKFNIGNLTTSSFNKSKVYLFNNPVENILQLSFDSEGTKEIQVYNSLGIMLETKSISSDFIAINTANYPSGVYFVKCKIDTEEQTIKVVKK